MKRLWLVPIVTMAVLVPTAVVLAATGEGSGFDSVVDSIELEYHAHATRIPFMGLASLIAGKATNGGVRGVHVAEFEHFSSAVDGEELTRMVEKKLGSGWERMIRETSKKGTEQTLIYIHPEGNRMGMFVLDLDGQELDVVQVSVDPDHLTESIAKYDHKSGENATADKAAGDDTSD
jgi:hypothetical protein